MPDSVDKKMHPTAMKAPRIRANLGEFSRACDRPLRSKSPGACSATSGDEAPSPRRANSRGAARRGRPGSGTRNSRDPRPVGDKSFASQCARNVIDLLTARGYSKTFSHEKLLKDPSTREFYDVFKFLLNQLDPHLQFDGKMEDEVPAIMKRLKYPVEVNRSKLQAISGPNTWPQLLAVLAWLADLVRVCDELIEPLALCQIALRATGETDQDIGDHQILRSLHENYVNYLSGKEEKSDEERLRQIYTERIQSLNAEIQRLEAKQSEMTSTLQKFISEHDRILELKKQPKHLAIEADRLKGLLQVQEQRVQHIEQEMASKEVEAQHQLVTIEELQALTVQLNEDVEAQAYSKRDIERLHCERRSLQTRLRELKAEADSSEREVWELGLRKSTREEELHRLARQVNEYVDSLSQTLTLEEAEPPVDWYVRPDVSELSDDLLENLDERRRSAQASAAKQKQEQLKEDETLHEIFEAQRLVREELADKERACLHLKNRQDQLMRIREDFRRWSAAELDDGLRTAEATEDALHEASSNTTAFLREAAEVDRLQLFLEEFQLQATLERAQLKDEIRREEERLEQHRLSVMRELDGYAQATDMACDDVKATFHQVEPTTLSETCTFQVLASGY